MPEYPATNIPDNPLKLSHHPAMGSSLLPDTMAGR